MRHRVLETPEDAVGRDESPVVNPATGRPFAAVPRCEPGDVGAVVERAHRAFGPWARRSIDERAALLRLCGKRLAAEADELARLLTLEQGKPLDRARAEVELSAEWFDRTADLILD